MKVGLMLGGGGARGSYQIGILKALDEYGLKEMFSAISGVSIGALNGYFYLSTNSYQTVLDAWFYGVDNNPIEFSKRQKGKGKKGLFSNDVLYEMEEKYADKEIFKNTKTDLYITVLKIKNPKITSMVPWRWEKVVKHANTSKNPLKDAISSSSIPIIFGANEVDNSYFIDGGLADNNPIDILIEKGCNLIFACSLDYNYDYKKYKDKNITIVNITSTNVFPRGIVNQLVGVIDFKKSLFIERMNYGYYVMSEMIKECVKLGILKIEHKKYVTGTISDKFKIINVPLYVKANIKIMREEYETKMKGEKK
ncbi:MAG: patatin-like phospholipase family protein [Acholeplasmatales bacterium]